MPPTPSDADTEHVRPRRWWLPGPGRAPARGGCRRRTSRWSGRPGAALLSPPAALDAQTLGVRSGYFWR